MGSFEYHQYRPSPQLSSYVDCFWTIENDEPDRLHRVLPDGCADILFLNPAEDRHELALMGALTKAAVFPLPKGRFAGVHFRPGLSTVFARIPGPEIVDSLQPLKDHWALRADHLAARLLEARSAPELVLLLEAEMIAHLNRNITNPGLTGIQRALCWAAEMKGRVRVDDLAWHCGLSSRQFRRLCLELTGLTPKHVCRVLRLHHAADEILAANANGLARLAQDCGYYDQAHLTNEFRTLAGLTPTEYGTAPD
jgi:AraC-like DNA-binding protein